MNKIWLNVITISIAWSVSSRWVAGQGSQTQMASFLSRLNRNIYLSIIANICKICQCLSIMQIIFRICCQERAFQVSLSRVRTVLETHLSFNGTRLVGFFDGGQDLYYQWGARFVFLALDKILAQFWYFLHNWLRRHNGSSWPGYQQC